MHRASASVRNVSIYSLDCSTVNFKVASSFVHVRCCHRAIYILLPALSML